MQNSQPNNDDIDDDDLEFYDSTYYNGIENKLKIIASDSNKANLSDQEIYDMPKNEIVNHLFNDKIKMVTKFSRIPNSPDTSASNQPQQTTQPPAQKLPTKSNGGPRPHPTRILAEAPIPVPSSPPIQKLNDPTIIVATDCPQDAQAFRKFFSESLVRLISGLPHKGWMNRTMRFFSRGPRYTLQELGDYTTAKHQLENDIGFYEQHGNHPLKSLPHAITQDRYEAQFNTFCKCYLMLKYIRENKNKIDVKNMIEFLTKIVNLIDPPEGKFPDNVYDVLYATLENIFNPETHAHANLLPRNSNTFRDLVKLIPGLQKIANKTGGKRKTRRSKRGHRVTTHLTRKSRTRKSRASRMS